MTVPSYQVLVIDDSKRDVLLLDRTLQQADDAAFSVTRVESAQAGLTELSEKTYDLVLLDYYLPDMDGLAFLEAKQDRDLTTPVIMLSVFSQDRLPVSAMQAGALDYFAKDQVSSSLLSKAIVQAIEKVRLQTQASVDADRLRELEAKVAATPAAAQRTGEFLVPLRRETVGVGKPAYRGSPATQYCGA